MVDYVNVYLGISVFFFGIWFSHATDKEQTALYDTKLSDVVFIVLSQPNPQHARKAAKFKSKFEKMSADFDLQKEEKPELYLAHKKWPSIGTWTIFPLIKQWSEEFPQKKWLFVCEEGTDIHLGRIWELIKKFNPEEDWFLGHALRDREATIIHHFAEPSKLTFPDFAAGIFLSAPLIKKLANLWQDENAKVDFSIDPKHELASYILMENVRLTDVPELCSETDTPDCATTFPVKFPSCGPALPNDDLFVAVKTCEQFHRDRVPVVKQTWAKETSNLEFYSDKADESIPTIDLGVPNTERGHCGKTMALMKRAVTEPHISSKKWLLIADDDTIINIHRLRRLLTCYSANTMVALGERYGYQAARGHGYDYITGGGGMVFSMPLVQKLVEECQCPSNDAPDDMILGMCLKRMDVPITHVPYFHQARPEDYSWGYLKRQIPISFHKHWNCDPFKVYDKLKKYDRDEERARQKKNTGDKHEEL